MSSRKKQVQEQPRTLTNNFVWMRKDALARREQEVYAAGLFSGERRFSAYYDLDMRTMEFNRELDRIVLLVRPLEFAPSTQRAEAAQGMLMNTDAALVSATYALLSAAEVVLTTPISAHVDPQTLIQLKGAMDRAKQISARFTGVIRTLQRARESAERDSAFAALWAEVSSYPFQEDAKRIEAVKEILRATRAQPGAPSGPRAETTVIGKIGADATKTYGNDWRAVKTEITKTLEGLLDGIPPEQYTEEQRVYSEALASVKTYAKDYIRNTVTRYQRDQ